MIHDDLNIALDEIFKNEKENQFRRFKYSGDVDKMGLPHGEGRKDFIYDEKDYFDWEMLKWTPYRNTQAFFLDLGLRNEEIAHDKNGKKHGQSEMYFRDYETGEEENAFYCTWVDDKIEGYALRRGIFDDNNEDHTVMQFHKGKIIHSFNNSDISRDKHLKKLDKSDDFIYNIVMGELNVFFTDETYLIK